MKVVFYMGTFHSYTLDTIVNPMFKYLETMGVDVSKHDGSIEDISNSKVFIYHGDLNQETIPILKDNGNVIFSCDINDHSWLSNNYARSEYAYAIDYIFKFAGIQQTEESDEIYLDNDTRITKQPRAFGPEDVMEIYNHFVNNDRIFPFPHIPHLNFENEIPPLPFGEKQKNVLVRGGHHFYRVIMLLKMMLAGVISKSSGFNTRNYAEFYCKECENRLSEAGIFVGEYHTINCDRPMPHWFKGDFPDNYFNVTSGLWNNRCVPMYFRFVELFEKVHGEVDKGDLNLFFNSIAVPENIFMSMVRETLFYSDFKWIFSIYVPPRFWEAASVGTVSYYPKRVNDQKYFPEMSEGENYLTFDEEMTDFGLVSTVTKGQYDHIVNNNKKLYTEWINRNSPDWAINTNSLKRMCDLVVNNNGV